MRFNEILNEQYRNPFDLPIEVIQAFHELGEMQRDRPEKVMLKIQHTMGGGVLNPVVEHAGDIIHRITHQVGYGRVGYEEAKEKVERVHKYLSSGYGFGREMRENIRNNSDNPNELHRKIDQLLTRYAQEHDALPAYNNLHLQCKKVTVAIGNQDWSEARSQLFSMQRLIDKGRDAFTEAALQYELNESGQPKVIG